MAEKEFVIKCGGVVPITGTEHCRHIDDVCLTMVSEQSVYAYCTKCGIRSPLVPFVNGVWGPAILREALADGTAYRDLGRLVQFHSYNYSTKEAHVSLMYFDGPAAYNIVPTETNKEVV